MMNENEMADLRMDADNLYRQETFTDQKVGTLVRMMPVTANGEPDESRQERYIGQAQIMTPMGAIPLSFEIPAASLAEAVEGFAAEAEKAIERTIEEARQMQRESASQLVIPGQGEGGKIQIP